MAHEQVKFSSERKEDRPSKYRMKNVGRKANSSAYAQNGPGQTSAAVIPKVRDY